MALPDTIVSKSLTFPMLRAGIEQLDKIKREDYPSGPDGDLVYRSYLVGKIYHSMADAKGHS